MSAVAANCQRVGAAGVATGNGTGQQPHQLVLVITRVMQRQRTNWAAAVEVRWNVIERYTGHFTSMLPTKQTNSTDYDNS